MVKASASRTGNLVKPDLSIDAILVQINKEAHSDEHLALYDENHPRPFTDKIDRLKTYFKRHPALSRYKDEVLDYARGLLILAVERNEALHGILEDYDRQKQTYSLNGMRYRKKTNDFLNRHQVNQIGRIQSVNLAHYGLCEISKQLFTLDGVERLQRPK